MVTYYEIGKLLSEAGKHYGENIICEYSKNLMLEVNKKYTRSTLFRMKQFYTIFSNEKVAPMVRQLTWSHCLKLMSNKEYEHLLESTKNKLITYKQNKIEDLIKGPILIKNSHNIKIVNEKALHTLILENIESFMKELGEGFCFIGSKYKIKIDNNYNYTICYYITLNINVMLQSN